MAKYLGKAQGFGQRFDPPIASPYLEFLIPECGDYIRSEVSLADIRNDIRKYQQVNTPCTDAEMRIAISRAHTAFRLTTPVPLLHLNDVFKQDLPIWSASPGLPWTQQGYKTKSAIRDDPEAVNRVRWFWHSVKSGKKMIANDCCAFIRAQLVKRGERKVRAVHGYPATMVFGEAVFALPLIEEYRKGKHPIAYGYETGIGGCRKLINSFKGQHFLGIDFKSFDKTVPEWLIRVAFDILFLNLDVTTYRDYGIPRSAYILRMWDYIVNYFIHTPIRMCNGERYRKDGGIASGSYFTQLIGSIINYILIQYTMLKINATITAIKVLGDDSIVGLNRAVYPYEVSAILEPLGFIVNAAKSSSSPRLSDITFLGHTLNCGFPTKPRDKVIASLVYPEHPDRDWDHVASRALGILYANLGVDEFVDFYCRQVTKFRPFDLALTRGQLKMLSVLGYDIPKSTKPPDLMHMYFRLMGAR